MKKKVRRYKHRRFWACLKHGVLIDEVASVGMERWFGPVTHGLSETEGGKDYCAAQFKVLQICEKQPKP